MTAPRPYVTVVSGAPRSGTSMMMRMLERGGLPPLTDGLRAPDRDNPHGYYEFEPVKQTRADPSWVPRAVGRAVKMVHVLLRDLPSGHEYRVLLMRRRLDEVVASQRRMLERLGREAWKVPDERMAQMYAAQLDDAEAWLAARAGFRCLRVDYNALVETPRQQLERVAAFLDGLDVDAMATVVDPELYRNRV